jgi:hypothetical protein
VDVGHLLRARVTTHRPSLPPQLVAPVKALVIRPVGLVDQTVLPAKPAYCVFTERGD